MYIDKNRKYIDFDGNERTEDFYFHLKESDLVELNLGVTGGLEKMIRQIIAAQDMPEIMKLFKQLITMSYGVKTPDGKGFHRSKELVESYLETNAYSDFFIELVSNPDKAGEFVAGIIPSDLQERAQQIMQQGTVQSGVIQMPTAPQA
jgi:hypothetical protein